jgi:predicted alpha/beta superfamily hydrolase
MNWKFYLQNLFLLFVFLSIYSQISGQVNVSTGTIKRFENFASKNVDARNVDVWLPDGYSAKKKYAVLYMHDGQMLFDAATTWNKQEWGVDETIGRLIKEGKIKETIVVGVWNNGDYRHSEYFPQKVLTDIPAETREFIISKQLKNKPQADNYLKFLVEELKPYIDKNFSTRQDRKNTFIMGSSMGGLISIYAICEYPSVFGGAAGISTHLPLILAENVDGQNDVIAASFRTYLEKNLPKANTRKIYFDYGDQTLDALYPPLQKKVDDLIKAKGYTEKNWTTRSFPGESHSEESWAKRLDIPLEFLLAK